jgi:hypothetical protein
MQRRESLEHGLANPESLGNRRETLVKTIPKRPAREELHREIDAPLTLPELENADEMGTQAFPGDPNLPPDAGKRPFRVAVRADDLEGNLGLEKPVEGQIDGGMPAAAERLSDLIPVGQEPARRPIPSGSRLRERAYRLRRMRLSHGRLVEAARTDGSRSDIMPM